MNVRLISPKVSFREGEGFVQFIILGKIDRWKEALLTAWLLAWIFIGSVVMREYYYAENREMRMGLIIFLIFWAYYFWRVGRTWLYRRGGNELVRVEGDRLLLKRSFFTFGQTKTYYIDMIQEFKPIEIPPNSFSYTYENGWWVLGGEKLGFVYQSKFVKFAMQIDEKDAREMYRILTKHMSKAKRTQK